MNKLSKEKAKALHIYLMLETNNNYSTKKARYTEVAKRLNKPVNTITSWVRRYLDDYKKYLSEIEVEINAKISNFEGLTDKQTKFIIARLDGKSAEAAKLEAGYSENTKAADIEKTPKVQSILNTLRNKLADDTVFGAAAIINNLKEISDLGKKGINIVTKSTTIMDGPEGTIETIVTSKRKDYNLSASVAANKAMIDMLGYSWKEELKVTRRPQPTNEDVLMLDDDDLE